MQVLDVIVIGAGAAGMMAAAEAARRGRRTVLLEHNKAPGEKIRISGGGRCNFSNLRIQPDRFLSQNPKFALSALRRFTTQDFISRLDAAGITWHERDHGQLFCLGAASQIVTLFQRELQRFGAELRLDCPVLGVSKQGELFHVETSSGPLVSRNLVVASGGKSIPKMGATSLGYQIAQDFGLVLVPTRPALVPLTFGTSDLEWMQPLAGVSVEGGVSYGRVRFDEGVLFTHRGLSGPAVLQISSYWREGEVISVDLAAGIDVLARLEAEKKSNGRQALRTALSRMLPERLARAVEEQVKETRPLAELSRARLVEVAEKVSSWQLVPQGTEGYRTAEVTLGGVDTAGLDGRTMQAKSVPGLYFVGEVVDVTGWLGGYNFQWAWSSGWVAGQSV